MVINWTGSSVIDAYNTASTATGDASSFELLNKVIAEATVPLSILPIQPTVGRPTSGQTFPRYVPGV